MPIRDDDTPPNRDYRQDRWRREGPPADERETRSFGGQGRFNSDQARYGRGGAEGEREPWRRDRYGSRQDQDRAEYGSGYDRSGSYGRGAGSDGYGYADQAYGVEAGGPARGGRRDLHGGDARDTWRPAAGAPYGDLRHSDSGPNADPYGAPNDYAFHPHAGEEFDHDYRRWRDEQLAAHDRDYRDWRKHQHSQYDDQYRRFRTERRDTFGKNFHEWRAQPQATTTPTAPEFDKEPNEVKAVTDGKH